MVRRPHPIRFLARLLVAMLVIGASVLGGMAVGLLAGSGDVQRTQFGTLHTSVRPSLDGHVSVYVPLVDWRVRLLDHAAPATIALELRGIDRRRAGEGLSSAQAATRSLAEVRRDSEVVIERAIRRGVVTATIGGMVGAAIAGAILSGVLLRRRWLLGAPVLGALVIVAVLVPSVRAVQALDDQHIEVVAAGGHARELPQVLRFATQLLDVGDEYEGHYRTALESLGNLATFASGRPHVRPDATAVLVSDLHDNVFVLDALDDFAGDDTVYAAGDFVQVGARIEERTARRVAALGGRLVAVSGNHDTPEYMESLARAGALVLDDARALARVDGLLVAGYQDPLERAEDSQGMHRLRVYGREYEQQRADFVDWWEALPERPDVLLVHQHGFAHRLLEHLRDTGDDERLVILTGHDHRPHVHVEGPHAIVDAGTVGAGGVAAVGEQEATFVRLEIADRRVTSVVTISVEPLTGRATSERTTLVG